MYEFQNPYNKKSSLDIPSDINSIIKENPDKVNVEVEKNEIILKKDLSGLFKGSGEKHYNGGIKTYLPEGSFVFSDDKSLAFDKADHEMFELIPDKKKYKQKDNTPAKLVHKLVNSKDYNSLISKIEDRFTDDITKKTAALMLTKHEDTLGKIAFIQEGKKDFPSGIPDFAKNVAPVYNTQVKNDIMEQSQYMKKGGYVNPYLPKARLGDYFTDPYKKSNTKAGAITPTGKSSFYNRGPEYLQSWEEKIPGISKMDNETAQSIIYEYTIKNHPEVADQMWKDAGLTNKGKQYPSLVNLTDKDASGNPLYTFNNNSLTDNNLKELKPAYVDGMFGYRQLEAKSPAYGGEPYPNITIPNTPRNNTIPQYNPLQIPNQSSQDVNWAFNPYQKANLAADALQYASARQEFPYRSQIQSPLVELERLNPQSALNQATNAASQAYRNNSSLNPYIAGANNSQVYGQALDSQNQIQSQYDNQNVQIGNQQNLQNNQIQRGDQQFNVQADQQYYQQSVEGRKNFDNLKDVGFNNLRGNFNDYVGDNQKLAYSIAALGPNSPFGYNFKTGQFKLTGKGDILAPSGNSRADYTEQLINRITNSTISEDKKLDLLTKLGVSKQLTLPQQKFGGVIKKNPYKK